MRIWDIDPGYLNRGSLLAEHRELHALYNVVQRGPGGFDHHPEPNRWRAHLDALCERHHWLVCEMGLRGIGHRSPLPRFGDPQWPAAYLDAPGEQYQILKGRYETKAAGRIPFPRNPGELWAQHKYSVMARDPALGKQIGREVAGGNFSIATLASTLVTILRSVPSRGRLKNALDHMWGYVREGGSPPADLQTMMRFIQERAVHQERSYLLHSTALGELARFVVAPCFGENE